MNAQKLNNNKIAISNTLPRKDAIQVIENLGVAEFYKLIKSARNWDKSLNDDRDIMFTTYENKNSKICKEFDRIFERRKLLKESNFSSIIENSNDTSKNTKLKKKKEEKPQKPLKILTSYRSDVDGTSKLIFIEKKQLIKIVRRKNSNDNINRSSSVCIDNKLREQFFADCKRTQYFKDANKYEILNCKEDKFIYEKWCSIIENIYKKGLEESIRK